MLKFNDPPLDVPNLQVRNGPLLLDKLHRSLHWHPLRDQDARPHSRTTVPATAAVREYHSSLIDYLERSIRTFIECPDWDRE